LLAAWRLTPSSSASRPTVGSSASTARMTKPKAARAAGDCLIVAPDQRFTISNHGADDFEAVCCMTAGGMAVVDGEGAFVPPWAV
jgi:hypothetical protein